MRLDRVLMDGDVMMMVMVVVMMVGTPGQYLLWSAVTPSTGPNTNKHTSTSTQIMYLHSFSSI